MTLASFDLRDAMIAYADDGRARLVPRRFDRVDPDDRFNMAIADFSDDASVHADHWEIHPAGDEILCVLTGRVVVTIERGEAVEEAAIGPGQAFIVPAGAWHHLNVVEPGSLLVVTPRAGSQLRPVASPDRI